MKKPARRYMLIALGVLSFSALEAALAAYADMPLSLYLRQLDATHHAFIDIFRAYTDFGKGKWFLWPTGIGALLCFFLAYREITPPALREILHRLTPSLFFVFVSVAVAGIITDILKPVIGRARPVLLERQDLYGFQPFTFDSTWQSMPSGHATTAFAAACALAILLPRGKWLFLLLAIVLAASRVMINAHYLADVLAGGAVGALTALALREPFGEWGLLHERARGWLDGLRRKRARK